VPRTVFIAAGHWRGTGGAAFGASHSSACVAGRTRGARRAAWPAHARRVLAFAYRQRRETSDERPACL